MSSGEFPLLILLMSALLLLAWGFRLLVEQRCPQVLDVTEQRRLARRRAMEGEEVKHDNGLSPEARASFVVFDLEQSSLPHPIIRQTSLAHRGKGSNAAAAAPLSSVDNINDGNTPGGSTLKGEEEAAESSAACVICLEDYRFGDRLVHITCGHVFHDRCIDPWFSKKKTCPLCFEDLERLASELGAAAAADGTGAISAGADANAAAAPARPTHGASAHLDVLPSV
ncbi:unnamed protein product [Phaeothamnion confervicola]